MVQSLRDLHDIILTLGAFCKGNIKVIETLESIQGFHFDGEYSLKPFSAQLVGNIESLSVFGNRARNAIELVCLPFDRLFESLLTTIKACICS